MNEQYRSIDFTDRMQIIRSNLILIKRSRLRHSTEATENKITKFETSYNFTNSEFSTRTLRCSDEDKFIIDDIVGIIDTHPYNANILITCNNKHYIYIGEQEAKVCIFVVDLTTIRNQYDDKLAKIRRNQVGKIVAGIVFLSLAIVCISRLKR